MTVQEVVHFRYRPAKYGLIAHLDGYLTGTVLANLLLLDYLLLLFKIDPEYRPGSEQREYDTHDSQRIGHRITGRDSIVRSSRNLSDSLLSRTETGRIGHRSGHNSHHRRHRSIGYQVYGHRYHDSQNDNHDREHVHPHSAFLERGEETGTDLQTEREDKKYESEVTDETPD